MTDGRHLEKSKNGHIIEKFGVVIHASLLLSVVKILYLEIRDGDSRYFQIQNHHISAMRT